VRKLASWLRGIVENWKATCLAQPNCRVEALIRCRHRVRPRLWTSAFRLSGLPRRAAAAAIRSVHDRRGGSSSRHEANISSPCAGGRGTRIRIANGDWARPKCRLWVTPGRTQVEHIETASPPKSGHLADIPGRPLGAQKRKRSAHHSLRAGCSCYPVWTRRLDRRIRHLRAMSPQVTSHARTTGTITMPTIASQCATRKTVVPAHVGSVVKEQ